MKDTSFDLPFNFLLFSASSFSSSAIFASIFFISSSTSNSSSSSFGLVGTFLENGGIIVGLSIPKPDSIILSFFFSLTNVFKSNSSIECFSLLGYVAFSYFGIFQLYSSTPLSFVWNGSTRCFFTIASLNLRRCKSVTDISGLVSSGLSLLLPLTFLSPHSLLISSSALSSLLNK